MKVFFVVFVVLIAIRAEGQTFLACQANPANEPKRESLLKVANAVLSKLAGDDVAARFGVSPVIEIRPSSRPNAYALVPARILLTSALFEIIQNQDELAFVLAHEIGHLIDLDRSLHSTSPEAFFYDSLHQSHTYWENRADTFALEALRKAGISPSIALDFMRRLAHLSGNSVLPNSSLLPRISSLENSLNE